MTKSRVSWDLVLRKIYEQAPSRSLTCITFTNFTNFLDIGKFQEICNFRKFWSIKDADIPPKMTFLYFSSDFFSHQMIWIGSTIRLYHINIFEPFLAYSKFPLSNRKSFYIKKILNFNHTPLTLVWNLVWNSLLQIFMLFTRF